MPLEDDLAYDCPSCGERNFLGVDRTGGSRQEYVEDCPVCCRPLRFAVRVAPDGPMIEGVGLDE